METLGKIFAFILVMILSFLTGLFATHVILSIANLFTISFISQFSFIQVYGMLILIELIKYSYSKQEDEEFSDIISKLILQLFSNAFTILTTWGISFIAYYIIS